LKNVEVFASDAGAAGVAEAVAAYFSANHSRAFSAASRNFW
jgi:hypothetical protein